VSELVLVGRVGRPHGLDGSFVVEEASEAPERFAQGAELLAAGEPARVLASKRAGQGRLVVQLDRMVGDVRFVNAGSVGMPYEDEVAAFWTLLVDHEVEFRKTGFDIERAAAEIGASAWPGAQEFVAENLLVAPSRADAVQRFEGWR
jgi:hypothetical protein